MIYLIPISNPIAYQVTNSTVTVATTPTVTTTAVSDEECTAASGGGNVTDDGGETVTARGVCWSTSENPTTDDDKTTDGTGTGSFISDITGLSYNTAYHVRAYATNCLGTSYGEDRTFTTLCTPPVVTTTTAIRYNQQQRSQRRKCHLGRMCAHHSAGSMLEYHGKPHHGRQQNV